MVRAVVRSSIFAAAALWTSSALAASITFGFDVVIQAASAPYADMIGRSISATLTFQSDAPNLILSYGGNFGQEQGQYSIDEFRMPLGAQTIDLVRASGLPANLYITPGAEASYHVLAGNPGQLQLGLNLQFFGTTAFPTVQLVTDPTVLNDPTRGPYSESYFTAGYNSNDYISGAVGKVYRVPEPNATG